MGRRKKEPIIVSSFRKRFPKHIYIEIWDKGFKDGTKPDIKTMKRWMAEYMRMHPPEKNGVMEWV